jgi:F420H(2)-dependent quinone reductase
MSQDTSTAQQPQPKQGSSNFRNSLQHAFTSLHVSLYRLTNGAIGGKLAGTTQLILTTTGRKSGQKRDTPLQYNIDGDRFIVMASNSGAPKHPAWFLNLQANPQAQIQMGAKKLTVNAHEATGDERTRIWDQITSTHQNFADYQKRTTRQIPVVILTPIA